jgi:hypothetical protein
VKFSGFEYFKVAKYHSLDTHIDHFRAENNTTLEIDKRFDTSILFPCFGNSIKEIHPCGN